MRRRVDAVLERSAARHKGLVVGVHAEGETGFWSRGAAPGAVFEIGSITKTFTTTLLAGMANDGLVALDDPVARHLPVAPPVNGREITLEDLATHRSGLPGVPAGMLLPALTTERKDPYARLDDARMRHDIAATKPKRPPGGRPHYSNYGMGLLGYALAHRTGSSYEALMRARIGDPLGLDDTWIATPPIQGHTRFGRPTPPWDLAELAGAGGIRSTAADVLAYLALHAPGAEGPLADAARETRRPRAKLGQARIGLAWMIVPARGGRREFVMHDGGTGGFRSFAAVVPETGVAVVVLANQARGTGALGMKIVAAMG